MEKNKLVERNWCVQFDERNSCFAEFRLYRPSFPILRWTDLIHFSQPAKYSWRNFGPREKLFPRSSSKPVLSTLHFSTFGTEKRRINLPFYRMRKIPNEYFNSNDFHPELMIDWIEKEEKRKSVCDCIIGTRLFASRLRFAQEERYVSLSRRVSSWLHFISSTYAFDIKTNCRCCAGYSSTTFRAFPSRSFFRRDYYSLGSMRKRDVSSYNEKTSWRSIKIFAPSAENGVNGFWTRRASGR